VAVADMANSFLYCRKVVAVIHVFLLFDSHR